jgi:cytochrome oxidase assembly protein ShyY1
MKEQNFLHWTIMWFAVLLVCLVGMAIWRYDKLLEKEQKLNEYERKLEIQATQVQSVTDVIHNLLCNEDTFPKMENVQKFKELKKKVVKNENHPKKKR